MNYFKGNEEIEWSEVNGVMFNFARLLKPEHQDTFYNKMAAVRLLAVDDKPEEVLNKLKHVMKDYL